MHDSMKRLATYASSIGEAIFKDGRYLYGKQREWDRDLSRFLMVVNSRGAYCLLEEFPALSKHFAKCLDRGAYTRYDGLLSRPAAPGEQVPLFLRDVFLRIFDPDGQIVRDPCPNAVLFLRTLFGCWKTIRLPCSNARVQDEVDNFVRLEAQLPHPTLEWDSDDLGAADRTGLSMTDLIREADLISAATSVADRDRLARLQQCFDIVASQMGLPPNWGDPSEMHVRHGPGVVAEKGRGQSKYAFRHWPSKLQRLFPSDLWAHHSFGVSTDQSLDGPELLNHEHPSRLIAVPKTITKPRLIAAEPSYHQWIQQGLWTALEAWCRDGLFSQTIRFRDQSFNQDWALEGSRDVRNNPYATIDLSEASDRLSLYVVERFFHANPAWLDALAACRTRYVAHASRHGTAYLRLRKFSSMGSAVIFPLQSIIYATIAASCLIGKGRPTVAKMKQALAKVRVFGDDIIVPNTQLAEVCSRLTLCGLKVNESKTFSGKYFRESCGIEAFRGYNVTPPRLREIPSGARTQVPSLVEVSNNFYRAGFWNASQAIQKYTDLPGIHLPICNDLRFPLALFSYVGVSLRHLRSRFNRSLQRREWFCFKTIPVMDKVEVTPAARLMKYFHEAPEPDTLWSSDEQLVRSVKVRSGWVAP